MAPEVGYLWTPGYWGRDGDDYIFHEGYWGTDVGFNGGNGGVQERATSQEDSAGRGRHIAPVAEQTQHAQSARGNSDLRASQNHGKPPIAATTQPGAFKDSGAVSAREGGAVHSAPAAANNNARPNNESNRPNNTEIGRPNN